MGPKRLFSDHEGDGRYSKRKPVFRTIIEDLARGPSANKAWLENFFRRLVREEVEQAVFRTSNASSRHSVHQAGPSGGGSGLELRFTNKLPTPIFTGSRIESKDSPPHELQIVLFDTVSQSIVKTGPLSSVKVEIVALNADFGRDEQEDWTEKQFSDHIQREREGRRPLVTGERTITLSEGVGFLNNVVFTDNSSWTRSNKFRLGARVVQRSHGEARIREARSEPFRVKDHRGEQYQKHHPPRQRDEVWRLEKIAKDGAFHSKLSQSGIGTVGEFLQLYITNPSALRQILDKCSKRTWNLIVDHAMKCVLDDNRIFAFHQAQHQITIIFNSIYNVVGASFNNQYIPVDEFNPTQRVLVDSLKQQAYRNVGDLVALDWPSIVGPSRSLPEPSNNPTIALQQDFPVVQPDPPQPDIHQQPSNQAVVVPQTSRTSSFSFDEFTFANFNLDNPAMWSAPSTSQMQFFPTNLSSPENSFHFHGTSIPSGPWNEPGTSFVFTANNNEATQEGFFPVNINPGFYRKGWSKVRTAFKCLLSVKHAARKMPARPTLYWGY